MVEILRLMLWFGWAPDRAMQVRERPLALFDSRCRANRPCWTSNTVGGLPSHQGGSEANPMGRLVEARQTLVLHPKKVPRCCMKDLHSLGDGERRIWKRRPLSTILGAP